MFKFWKIELLAEPLLEKIQKHSTERSRRTTSPSPDKEAAPTKTLARTWKQATRSVPQESPKSKIA